MCHLKQWFLILLGIASLSQKLPVQATDPNLTRQELAQVSEIRHLVATYGWPGWNESATIILLIQKDDADFLIGHPLPPPGFVEVQPRNQEPIFRQAGHLVPIPAATAWQVGDEWVAAIPVLDEFQQTIDEQLGAGVIVLDEASYIRSVVHEAFHAYQMDVLGGADALPPIALGDDDLAWLQNLSTEELATLDEKFTTEGQALNELLNLDENTSEEVVRAALETFLHLRAERRALLPEQAVAYERGIEWMEGAARYTETRLMLLAGAPDYTPVIDIDYQPSEGVWAAFSDQVSDPASIPGSYRERFYVLGAAQLFVLDQLIPGWQADFLADGLAAEDLLAEWVAE